MELIVETHDSVAVLTLSDPERRNALTAPLVDAIIETFDRLEAADAIRAVVITGAAPAFCSGADTSSLSRLTSSDADATERGSVVNVYEGFLRVLRSSLPTIAAVNGAAVGAGFNLALACDVRLAAESARFDAKFLRIGLHPGGGHLWLLERAVGPQTAAAITLFGQALNGEDAVARGLAWSCHANDELVSAAIELAQRCGSVPKALMARSKLSLRAAPWQPNYEAAIATEFTAQTWSFEQGWFGQPR